MEEELCRGWTKRDIEALYAEASEGERRLLETMAQRPVVHRRDLQAALGEGPERSVDGYLGNLGKRAHKLGVKDRDGSVSWPFFINSDDKTGEALYLMPKQVAEVIASGSRRDAPAWEL